MTLNGCPKAALPSCVLRTSHCRNGITSCAAIGRRCLGLANRFADGPYRKPQRAIWQTMWLSESFKGVDLENSLVIAGVAYPLRIRRQARASSCRLTVDAAKRE